MIDFYCAETEFRHGLRNARRKEQQGNCRRCPQAGLSSSLVVRVEKENQQLVSPVILRRRVGNGIVNVTDEGWENER